MPCKPCQVMNRIWPINVKPALRPCSGAACTLKAPQLRSVLCRTCACRSLGHGVAESSARQSLQKNAAAAEEEMTEFLRPLLERLAGILHSRPSVDLQAGALAAISSAAAAAGKGFTPYARDALVLLRGFMEVSEVSQPYTMPVSGPYGQNLAITLGAFDLLPCTFLSMNSQKSPDLKCFSQQICKRYGSLSDAAAGRAALPGTGDGGCWNHCWSGGRGGAGGLPTGVHCSSPAGRVTRNKMQSLMSHSVCLSCLRVCCRAKRLSGQQLSVKKVHTSQVDLIPWHGAGLPHR